MHSQKTIAPLLNDNSWQLSSKVSDHLHGRPTAIVPLLNHHSQQPGSKVFNRRHRLNQGLHVQLFPYIIDNNKARATQRKTMKLG